MTAGIINMVDEQFFLLTADNMTNMGLQFFFALFYVFILLITALFLTFRYIIVAVGVVLVPIGVFLYFIPFLNSYGKLILNFLGICIFVAFFDSVVFLVCSELLNIEIFQNFKILVMITAFFMSDVMMLYFMFFSAIKSAFKTGGKIAATTASVAKYLA
jgi:hypothetical protein